MTSLKTRQQIFDTAYRGLASQGFRKSAAKGRCLYRGPNGRKCAIGWCIPDDVKFDEATYTLNKALDDAGISQDDDWFCCELQTVHDSARSPDDMKGSLADFADEYDLTIPEVSS